MSKLVIMTIICFVPDGNNLKEAWRIEKNVTLEHCLVMNRTFAQGGFLAAVTVRCSGYLSE